MPKLIDKRGEPIANAWILLPKDTTLEQAQAAGGCLIVPLQLWLEHKHSLLGGGRRVAVWLDSDETVAAIAADLPQLPLVALNFPVFSDGRNYTNAARLHRQHGYTGEIRAIGDVLRDQLFYMRRCGFSSFDLRDSVKLDDARRALQDFHDNYQSTIEQPEPLFRRRSPG
ncbi:MAG: DUF934 domain-containing protein [Pseudohongiellaceae bacterium]